jgi:hypothetical protein
MKRTNRLYILLMTMLLSGSVIAQSSSILDRSISFECRQQPLGQVLELLADKGGFYFSYAGSLLNKDSLVTLPLQNRTIRQTLDLLFKGRLQYTENGRYLILQPNAQKDAQVSSPPGGETNRLILTGIIRDERTGEKVVNASVYAPVQLVATLSRKDGSFTVRLRNKGWPIVLTVSKDTYIDTIIRLQPESSRDLTISILPDASPPKASLFSPADYPDDSITVQWQADSVLIRSISSRELVHGVEITGIGKFMLSYRLRMQSLNLKRYFVQRPVQLSLVPGLSTNGLLNSQVINKFSLNIVGGYSAGLHGVELGGAFNIDRLAVKGVQAAGAFNMAGGAVSGVQLAGAFNADLDSMTGVQMAGGLNIARYIDGAQYSGGLNLAEKVNGAQIGVVNITRHLKGIQLGVVNIADTSDGVSYGLVNLVRHGMHELSVYADEFSPINLALRIGTPAFYSVYLAGMNPVAGYRSYYYGIGFGHQFAITPRLALRTEATLAHVSPADLHQFDKQNFVYHFNLDLHWRVTNQLAISVGPSLGLFSPDGNYTINGQSYHPLPIGYHTQSIKNGNVGWIGWRAAINLF